MLPDPVRLAIYDHVYAHPEHEVGGVLVGGVDGHVTGSIAALEAIGKRASVTFTHDAWGHVHEQLDRDFPDDQILGWYHSHPGFGIFLSQHDLFIHEHFFSGSGQIAYVVDPLEGTEGVFGWRDGAIVALEEGPAARKGLGLPRRGGGNLGRIALLLVLVGSLAGAGAAVLLRDEPESPKPAPAKARHTNLPATTEALRK